ncbi:MAG: hypothetical protein KDA37_18385, partial [Planctomycetales bacterium]|nr:hypothetical protein [Planctomycetales bacterium]
MDDPDLADAPHHAALAGLSRVNWFSATSRHLWAAILPLARQRQQIRVLDLGSGGGDVLCRLALYANQANLSFVGVGCDLRETACRHARQEADRWLGEAKRTRVEFVQLNCLHDELPSDFD